MQALHEGQEGTGFSLKCSGRDLYQGVYITPFIYHVMKPIYQVEKDVIRAKERLRKSDFPDSVKEKIVEFITFIKEANGITKHREYFYYTRLQVLADVLRDKLLNPSREDVIMAISNLRDRKTNRHTNYSAASISDFKKVLKKFVKYVNDGELPKFWNDIHAEKIGSRYSEAGDMVEYGELQSLLKACRNNRDKAVFSLLWDSGIRASELLLLKIKDFQRSPDSLYATLNIKKGSKTYKQRVVVLTGDSVVLVSNWIDDRRENPDFNEDDFLFIGIGKENKGESLTYEDLRMLMKKVWERSGMKKKITPHLFRHSAATRFATEMPTQTFVKQMGWASNKMADNYVHMDTKAQIITILKSQGIPITEEELKKPKSKVTRRCPRCHNVNTGGSRFCNNCGSPMLMEDFQKLENERQKVVNAVQKIDSISDGEKKLLNVLSPESMNEVLLEYLKRLKAEGRLEEVAKNL